MPVWCVWSVSGAYKLKLSNSPRWALGTSMRLSILSISVNSPSSKGNVVELMCRMFKTRWKDLVRVVSEAPMEGRIHSPREGDWAHKWWGFPFFRPSTPWLGLGSWRQACCGTESRGRNCVVAQSPREGTMFVQRLPWDPETSQITPKGLESSAGTGMGKGDFAPMN
jgi:hypothetical protein